MTDWAIPLIPRPQIGYSGEHAVCEFEVLTLPEEGFTYYLEVKEKKKEPNTILLTAESDRLTIELASEMLGAAGIKKAQVVAYGSENDETPIKKSNIFEIEVKDSINATKAVEPHYQTALEQLAGLLNEKQDKTTIYTNTTDTSATLTLEDNTEYRYIQEMTTLSLTMPNGNFISSIVFKSGSTATVINYSSSIKWSGDDVATNIFEPVADKVYNIVFWFDGININAIARGI